MSVLHEIPSTVRKYLDDQGVLYELVPHPRDYSAQRTAADTHTPGGRFAKCLVLRIDGRKAMVVLPADHRLDVDMLRHGLSAREVSLVGEEELRAMFPDCETGAEPPLGQLYGVPVYVAAPLAVQETITFNAGTHEEVIRMTFSEFRKLTEPTVIDCSVKVRV